MNKTYKILLSFFLILISGMGYSQSVPSYVPTNGLVGWWGFNGNAQDGSGNGNHGTVNGATLTTDRFGNQNGAYSFDGVGSNIAASSNNIPAGDRTISIWFYGNDIGQGSSGRGLIGYGGNGTCGTSSLIVIDNAAIGGNHLEVSGHCQNQSVQYNYGQSHPNFAWYNWVITFNNVSGTTFYLNGLYVHNSSVFPNQTHTIGRNLYFGTVVDFSGFSSYWDANVYPFNGKLDDIGIWNRALTQQEITNLYNSQLPTQSSLCLPTITTSSPSSVGVDTVVIGGDISNDGGSSIVLRGICYSTSPNPNMGNQRTEDGSGIGSFNTVLRGLTSSTTYYARSYAKNSNGVVVYGNEVSFTTSASLPGLRCPGTPTVTDIDGNVYNTVQIGNQCWMQSNLKVSKYRNGDNIPTGLSNSDWSSTLAGAYSIYNNDPVNDGLYGKLYNQYAVTDSRGLCPTGWHVPTDGEWNVLVNYLDPNADTVGNGTNQSSIAGGALKDTALQPTPGGWNFPNTGATNSSGFSALPGGYRGTNGAFYVMFNMGLWWSSSVSSGNPDETAPVSSGTNAWYRFLYNSLDYITRRNDYPCVVGISVRCLKD